MSQREEKTKLEKRLDIARGVFGIAIAICALTTVLLLGANMDTANLPGSNIKIAVYSEEPKKGQMKAVLDGYLLQVPIGAGTSTACTNVVHNNGSSFSNKLCMSSVAGKETSPREEGKPWSSGWVSALDCPRTIDTGSCAPFSATGPLSVLGMTTFGLYAIQTLLFTAHTGVALSGGELSLSAARQLVANKSSRTMLGLAIVWGVIGFGLFVWAAFSFQSMCDKLDTGLGRIVQTSDDASKAGSAACATSGCESSFLFLFMTYALALVWSSVPYVLVWFGVMESA